MRYIFFSQIFISITLFAQHSLPVIDSNAISHWPYVTGYKSISNDFNYVQYSIENEPAGHNTLCVKDLKSSWEINEPDASPSSFTRDSRFLVFGRNDSVCILSLATKALHWISRIESFRLFEQNSADYLVYSVIGKRNLVFRNMVSGDEKELTNIRKFAFCNGGKTIFLVTVSKEKDQIRQCLSQVTIDDFQLFPIWSSYDSNIDIRLNGITCDSRCGQIAFTTHSGTGNAIWYYSRDLNKAIQLVNDSTSNLDNDVKIGDISEPGFSHDEQRLFVTLEAREDPIPHGKSIAIDIWNYKDLEPKSQQMFKLRRPEQPTYIGVLNLGSHCITRLNYNSEAVTLFKGGSDTLACISRWEGGSPSETNWNPKSKRTILLISSITGKQTKIHFSTAGISPSGKYLVGYDGSHQNIYLHNIISNSECNITNLFPQSVRIDEDFSEPGPKQTALNIADWVSRDSAIIIYDKYDIWMIDPVRKKAATCLTGGFGRRHHIILRLIGRFNAHSILTETHLPYVLSAFSEESKRSGFASMRLGDTNSIKLLSFGPYFYEEPSCCGLDSAWGQIDGRTTFLVLRESASRSPNLFTTQDFVKFSQVSRVQPEDNYNWLSSEVVSWRCDLKAIIHGVLYKPMDFDPNKRYPMLITYYEQMSDNAYLYKRPGYATDNINIPWFVSRGYLVFTPDIQYQIGYPGRSACKSIVSGTKFLLNFPWVDPKRIAVAGHSWGGFETNYLVTHSNLYCAALSASAVSDFISSYGSLTKNGYTRQNIYEMGQSRIGHTPWERLDLYLENSPVLRANRVRTPILLMSNKEDSGVPFSQGAELFLALRRLKKKAWLLQYDGEDHTLSTDAGVDYTIRITQFFDHYCKGQLSPKWMTEGVAAKLKGIDSGLELDESGREP